MSASEVHNSKAASPATQPTPHNILSEHGRATLPRRTQLQHGYSTWPELVGDKTRVGDQGIVAVEGEFRPAEALPANSQRHGGDVSDAVNIEAVKKPCADVLSLLPKLRLVARLVMKDAAAADKLLELTLERAIAAVNSRDDPACIEAWLTNLLEDTHLRIGPELRRVFK